MIDIDAAAAGVVDGATAELVVLNGTANLDGIQLVRESARDGVVHAHGAAALTDGGTPSLTTPSTLVVCFVGDSTADASSSDSYAEWVMRLVELWIDRYDDAIAYSHPENASDIDSGWTTRSLLKLGTSDRLIVIWNSSYGGASFGSYTAARIDKRITDRTPDIVVLAMGINQNADVAQMALDMQSLIDDVGAALPGVQIVVSSENPLAGNSGSTDVRDAVQAVAADNGFLFVDPFAAFINYGDWESLLSDDVHPNAEGSQLWADTFNTATFLTAGGELVGTGDTVATCSTSTPAVACSTPTPALACTISA